MEPASKPGVPAIRMNARLLGDEWDAAWDALAGQCAETGFMQSSAWTKFKRLEGYATTRVGLFEGEELLGGASLLQYAGGEFGSIVVAPEGPVLPWSDAARSRSGLRLVLDEAKRLAAPAGDIGLRIEPHLKPPKPSLLRNWVRAPIDLTPAYTLMLDITQPGESLLASMHPKGRYNLRLSRRHGVRVVRSTDPGDIKTFYGLFSETSSRGGFYSEPYGFFVNFATALFPSETAVLYMAEWQGRVLAAILVIFFGRRATYIYGGSTRQYRHVMPVYPLHWSAIEEARRRGCREYDFYGYDPFGHPDHLYAGISRFKGQWGAKRYDYIGAHDCLFYDSLAEKVVERAGMEELSGPL